MAVPEKSPKSIKEKKPPVSSTTVVDSRTYFYHPSIVDDICQTGSNGHISMSSFYFFPDDSWESELKDVTKYKSEGIRNAIVVGFVTGPKGEDTTTMAERASWFLANLNSLVHPAKPWVKDICLTIPHFEARSDRDARPGVASLAQIIADAIVGARRKPKYVITLGDHSHRLHKYINREGVHHVAVTANQLLAQTLIDNGYGDISTVVAAPDIGAAGRADDFAYKLAKLLNIKPNTIELTIVKKERDPKKLGESKFAGFIRDVDVTGKTVIIKDDLTDTSGTLLNAASEFRRKGAKKIILVTTHAVHSTDKQGVKAKDKIENAFSEGIIDAYFITDSRPLTWEKDNAQIHIVPVGDLLGNISRSLLERGSISTGIKFRDHFFQPKHPAAMLKQIDKKRKSPKAESDDNSFDIFDASAREDEDKPDKSITPMAQF